MPARNIGSHKLSKKHADALAASKPNGRRPWSTKQRYDRSRTEGQRFKAALAIQTAVETRDAANVAIVDACRSAYEGGYLTIQEVAEFAGVNKVTVWAWFRRQGTGNASS